MCGRYTFKSRPKAIAEAFDLPEVPTHLEPRYNIAPTQAVPVVRLEAGSTVRRLALLRWGLIPSWADDPAIGNKLINARAETVAEKPAFRAAFKKRRGLILGDGFYEWQRTNGKTPFYFRLKDEAPFAFAGLFERWEKGAESVESCTLITTKANGVVGPVHDRMPVILKPEDYARWLAPEELRPAAITALLAPLPDDWMTAHPVGKLVNNPRNEGPRCIEPE